jgi:hypothetical protein
MNKFNNQVKRFLGEAEDSSNTQELDSLKELLKQYFDKDLQNSEVPADAKLLKSLEQKIKKYL